MKTFQDQTGRSVFKLPVSGEEVGLRAPKGKDLKALDAFLGTQSGAANMAAVYFLATQLSDGRLTGEALDELDAEDLLAIAGVINSFRCFKLSKA